MRIGQGYDVHAFTEGDHLVLGGVRIPYTHAFAAHSDGDVLIHAICDALLGALALGDIGQHFPDTSAAYAKIDSRILLRKVRQLIKDQGYQIANLDSIIVAQAPKMAAYMGAMRANLAADLDCELSQISVKATTTERLGFEGRKEGIAAHAMVLLVSIHRSI